ncbi:fatty acid 2-hydroxylase-like [Montipora capricornis]|uniref:fatty acid 2-hydroxylase-like n=1 Tax=Montipora foliosa TaxID=591990 RepID=UPI0035F11327
MADTHSRSKKASLPLFSVEDVQLHNKENDAWITHRGKVYDVSDFLERHPGGKDILVSYAGQDVTTLMTQPEIHQHTSFAYGWLGKYQIGRLKGNGDVKELDSTVRENLPMDGWREDLIDWNKAILPQVGRLRSDYLQWVHSPVDRPLRLFESGFVEFFSKTPWYVIPIIWIPVSLYFSYLTIQDLASRNSLENFDPYMLDSNPKIFLAFSFLFLFGILLWSFLEYFLHRFLFHLINFVPADDPFWITIHFFLHGQHHKVPFDGGRLVFPPVPAIVLATIFYTSATLMVPLAIARGIFAGGFLGYVSYDMMHYYLHHGSPTPGSYLHRLKKYHVSHHFEDQQKGFGISSKLWDYPFRTLPEKHVKAA